MSANISVEYTGSDYRPHHEEFSSWSDVADFATTYGVGASAEVLTPTYSRLFMEV